MLLPMLMPTQTNTEGNTPKMKPTRTTVFALFSAVITVLAIMIPSMAYAQEPTQSATDSASNSMVANVQLIENELDREGTSVDKELTRARDAYRQQLSDPLTSAQDRVTLGSLIVTLDSQLASYEQYEQGHVIRGAFNPIYTPAVAAVTAYFQVKGYQLSSELLTHASTNTTLNSTYHPLQATGSRVQASPVFTAIKTSDESSGTAAFPNTGDTVQKDLYYAIHAFSWTKASGLVTIRDRYDFAPGDSTSIAGVAVNTMYEAQQAGVLIPYYVVITR